MEWLLAYGHRTPSSGAVQITFDKQARRQLAKDGGTAVVKHLGRYLDTAIIVDPDTERIITVMWRH